MSVQRPRPAQNITKAPNDSGRQVGKSNPPSLCGIPPLIPENESFHRYGVKYPKGLQVAQQFSGVVPEKIHPFQIAPYSVPKMNSRHYYGTGQPGIGKFNPVDKNYASSANSVFQDFRTLTCSCCRNQLGYQHRLNFELFVCSPRCISRVTGPTPTISPPYRQDVPRDGLASLTHRGPTGHGQDLGSPVQKVLRTEVFDSKLNSGRNQGHEREKENHRKPDVGGTKGETGRRETAFTVSGQLGRLESSSFEDTMLKPTNRTPSGASGRGTAKRGGRGRSRGLFHGHGGSLHGDTSFYVPEVNPVTLDHVQSKELLSSATYLDTENCNPPAAKPLSKLIKYGDKRVTCSPSNVISSSRHKSSASQNHETSSHPVKLRRGWTFSDLRLSRNLKDNAECFIVYVIEVNKIVLQAVRDEESVKILRKSINEYCCKEKPLSKDRLPSDGDVVFAKAGNDENYYRGKVTKVDMKNQKVDVDFFEDGGVFPVHLSHCWEPCDEIMTNHPLYGITFTVSPFDYSLCHKSEKIARQRAEDHNFIIQPVTQTGKKKSEWAGQIVSTSSNETWDEIMRKSPTKPSTGNKSNNNENEDARKPFVTESPSVQRTNPTAETENTGEVTNNPESGCEFWETENVKIKMESDLEAENVKIKMESVLEAENAEANIESALQAETAEVKSEASYLDRENVQVKTEGASYVETEKVKIESACAVDLGDSESYRRYSKNMKTSETLKSGIKVRVRFIWSNSRLTVSAVDDDKAMEELDDAISKHVAEALPMNRDPECDEIVLAPYEDIYYRGKVLALDDKVVHVEFVDYGDQAHVEKSGLKEMSKEIGQHPIYGWTVLMSGVPEDAPLVESAELDLIDTEAEAQFQVLERLNNGICKGLLHVAHDRTWTGIILDALGDSGKS